MLADNEFQVLQLIRVGVLGLVRLHLYKLISIADLFVRFQKFNGLDNQRIEIQPSAFFRFPFIITIGHSCDQIDSARFFDRLFRGYASHLVIGNCVNDVFIFQTIVVNPADLTDQLKDIWLQPNNLRTQSIWKMLTFLAKNRQTIAMKCTKHRLRGSESSPLSHGFSGLVSEGQKPYYVWRKTRIQKIY